MEHKYSYKTCDRCGRRIKDRWYKYSEPHRISYECAEKDNAEIEEKHLIDIEIKKAKKRVKKIRTTETFNISFYNYRDYRQSDLCGKCMKQFRKFMRNEV